MPESKPVIDLAEALPSSNEFRTSLIMPNLSARFSMLREQDDPSTKIGKANDDSVLFPKRASRLNLFTHNPLTDITEVASLHGSVRPPFAHSDRSQSFDLDGYDSDGGTSIMSRAKPGEGNNFFGGRLKLYKIPMDSSSKRRMGTGNSQPDSAGMSGRVMYEKDVSLDLFQQHREKAREERRNQQGGDSPDEAEEGPSHSPAPSFSKDRGTTSSTTSAPSRDSTAATSIGSQSPSLVPNYTVGPLSSPQSVTQAKPGSDRNAALHRKLYGQALHQSNSAHPVAKDALDNDLGRARAASNDKKAYPVSAVKSSPSLNERSSRTRPLASPSSFGLVSPSASGPWSGRAKLDSNLRGVSPGEMAQGQMCDYTRPLSPPVSDGEDSSMFVSSLQGVGQGKATTMGLVNKPSHKFDEQEYSQRQLQMHQGRGPPILPKGTPTPVSTPATPEELGAGIKRDETSDTPAASDARVHAGSLVRRQNEELAALEAERTTGSRYRKMTPPSSQMVTPRNTLLGDGDEQPPIRHYEAIPPVPLNELSNGTHPAFRPIVAEVKFSPNDKSPSPKTLDKQLLVPVFGGGITNTSSDDLDHRTEGLGLSGLVRTHLRTDSDKSSVFPAVAPQFPLDSVSEGPKSGPSSPSVGPLDRSAQAQATIVQSVMAKNAQHFLNTATLHKNLSNNEKQRLADEEAGRRSQDSTMPRSWHDELQAKHHRGGSTETQQEREAFSNELAERRRRVEEKLKNVEVNSRSVSPAPSAETGPAKPGSGLSAMLRSRPSRSKINNNPPCPPIPSDQPAKVMKFLGLPASSADPGLLKKPSEELWKEEEERMLEDFGRRPKPKPKPRLGSSPTKDFPRVPSERASSKRSRDDDWDRSRQRSVTPASTRSPTRDRSTSDVTGRSKSRNGQYRDDLEKAMAEGTGSQAAYGMSNASNVSILSQPSIEVVEQQERSASSMSRRYRSHSRVNGGDYFESKTLKPLQTSGIPPTSLSARPSPRTPYSANSTPPIFETSPSISNSSTPTLLQAADGRTAPSLRSRKRSITKNMISDPTFISTTYAATPVNLPPSASLSNGSPEFLPKDPSVPAIPSMNPSRRRGRDGTNTSTNPAVLSTLGGRFNDSKPDLVASQLTGLSHPGERSVVTNGSDKRSSPLRTKPRLRKVSSEGGDMNSRARYQALMAGPSPALPTFPVKRGLSPTLQMADGGMF